MARSDNTRTLVVGGALAIVLAIVGYFVLGSNEASTSSSPPPATAVFGQFGDPGQDVARRDNPSTSAQGSDRLGAPEGTEVGAEGPSDGSYKAKEKKRSKKRKRRVRDDHEEEEEQAQQQRVSKPVRGVLKGPN